MTIQEITLPPITPGAKIKVVWVGWGGNKALNRIIQQWLDGVEFIAVNTDAQDLAANLSSSKVNIWMNITKWLWAWANPEIWRKSAEESENEIKQALWDADMVFITAWMWWWTGTWAAPVIAWIAKSMWILTIWIVTKPFSFEWKKRDENAIDGLAKMKENVDTLIVIPNDKIFNISDRKTSFKQAFEMIDKVLYLWIQWISELITKPWDINIDFADIKEIMLNSGNALLGIGYGAGEKRAVDAARKAIENPLLETNLDGAKKVIFAVSGGSDLSPYDEQADSKRKTIKLDNRWKPVRQPQSENFITRIVNQTTWSYASSQNWFSSSQTGGFSSSNVENDNTPDLTNNAFRAPNNSDEDWETPAFMTKKLNNWGENENNWVS